MRDFMSPASLRWDYPGQVVRVVPDFRDSQLVAPLAKIIVTPGLFPCQTQDHEW